jgi:hypothetical protein
MTQGKISSNEKFFCDYCGGNIQSDNPPAVEIKRKKDFNFVQKNALKIG